MAAIHILGLSDLARKAECDSYSHEAVYQCEGHFREVRGIFQGLI
jgi:hypothetical protein